MIGLVSTVKFRLKSGAFFIAKKHKDVRFVDVYYYEYYLLHDEKVITPPRGLTQKQKNMSVQDYKEKGRHEWWGHVKFSDYVKAKELLNGKHL